MNFSELEPTVEEAGILERCYSVLDEDVVAECHNAALEIANAELCEQDAVELLVPMLAKIIVRNVRAELEGSWK